MIAAQHVHLNIVKHLYDHKIFSAQSILGISKLWIFKYREVLCVKDNWQPANYFKRANDLLLSSVAPILTNKALWLCAGRHADIFFLVLISSDRVGFLSLAGWKKGGVYCSAIFEASSRSRGRGAWVFRRRARACVFRGVWGAHKSKNLLSEKTGPV